MSTKIDPKMKLQVSRIIQALIIINLASKISTTTINCSFDNISISIGHYNTIQGYGCEIQNLTSEGQVKIIGTHDNGKTNDDVTLIKYQINDEYQLPQLPQFDSSFCEKFTNIETVFVSQLRILSFRENSLWNCQNLSKLYFYENKIRELPENFLAKSTKLTVLNLDFNYLTELPDNFLKNQTALEELSLTNNQFITFSSNFFDSLSNLYILGLGSNKITAIDSKWFEKLENLVCLGLERNEIIEVPSNSFASIRYLVELNLSNNRIKMLNSNSFDGLRSLKTLKLDHNKIMELPDNIFLDTENLQELNIGHNKLTVINSISFGKLINFTTLYCHFNEIEGFDEKLIDKTAISDLDMTGNLCADGWNLNWNQIRRNLTKCFRKYSLEYESNEDTAKTIDTEVVTPSTHSIITTTTTHRTTENLDSIIITTESAHIPKIHDFEKRARPSCGRPRSGLQTIMRGTAVPRGKYPWNVALYSIDNVSNKKEYICGGSIVSNKTIVTAAHCFRGKSSSHLYNAGNIIVLVGAHNLSETIEIGRLTVAVRKIIIHPDWNINIKSFDADIALVELDEYLNFSNYIQPICLMNPGSDMESIKKGIVAGYGKSEFKDVEDVARIINMPIINYTECVKSSDHESLLSNRMFCAGYANGTGVCIGDSGSGLHVVYKNTYYLRGIVSASLHGEINGCDVNAYAVFTDVMKHKDFVESK
ncbi:uncharacterized protein [Chironomus tepperi]|uniref:uncharacterized protein n=1 Tax=Chironomus tepperi TaxID=113505 RepID=UPI00391F0C51